MINAADCETPTKRRKVRKGTRSCWSCKRRKVRCIFSSEAATICITCQQRGTKCVSQEVFDSETPPRESQRAHHTLRTSHIQGCAELPTPDSAVGDQAAAKYLDASLQCTTEALLKRLPREEDLQIVLHELNEVCLSFYASKLRVQPKRKVAPITSEALRCPQSHPVHLARQMLLLAVGMQHCCFKSSITGLTEDPRRIADSLARSAIELVTSNDLLIDGVESVDGIILASCYFTNKGDMHQAWLSLRRAVMVAQMLRLGDDQTEELAQQSPSQLDGSMVWSCCQGIERLVSLLVNLPTSLPLSELGEATGLPAIAKSMAARIIKRNSISCPQRALEVTFEINSQLLKISEELAALNKTGTDLPDIQTVFHNLCLQSMVLQLHAPYMLFAFDAIRRMHSTVACLHAGRDLLTRQMALMALNPIHPAAGMSFFMAGIAGIILILAHILGHTSGSTDNLFALQRPNDRGLLHSLLDRTRSLSVIEEDSLVCKCLDTLKTLMRLDALAADSQRLCVQKLPATTSSRDVTFSRLIIELPAFSRTVTLTRGGSTGVPGSGATLVIGGVGVLQISPEVKSHPSDTLRSVEAQLPGEAREQLGVDMSATVGDDRWPQQDSLDQDWLLDGIFDTSTFFDAFSRGTDDLQTTAY